MPADGDWHRLVWLLPAAGQGQFSPAWPHILRYPVRLQKLTVHASGKKIDGRLSIDDIAFDSQLAPEEMLNIDINSAVTYREERYRSELSATIRGNALEPLAVPLSYRVVSAADETILERRETVDIAPGRSLPLDLSQADFMTTAGPHTVVVTLPPPQEDKAPVQVEKTVSVRNAAFVLADFETGVGGKLADRVAEVAAKNGHGGLRWRYDQGRVNGKSLPLDLELPGQAALVGMWIHGNDEPISLRLHGHDHKNQDRIQSNAVTVDWDGWRFVNFVLPSASPDSYGREQRGKRNYPYTIERIEMSGQAANDNELFLDDITVCTMLPPAELVTASLLGDDRPDTPVAPGWTPVIRVANRSLEQPFKGALTYRVRTGNASDAAGNWPGMATVAEAVEPLELPPGKHRNVTPDWQSEATGPFHLQWSVRDDDDQAVVENVAEFLVMALPAAEREQLAKAIADDIALRRFSRIDTDVFALEWNELEPHPGRVNYGKFDGRIRKLTRNGAELMVRLGFSANWNSPSGFWMETASSWEGDAYAYPQDLRLFYEYVYETVRRYRRHVTHWEVWPYPDRAVEAANMDLDKYVRLLTIAQAAIRQADPDAKIASGTLSAEGIGAYLPKFLEKGGDLLDIVALDPVDMLLSPEIGFLGERVAGAVDQVKKLDPAKEVWITEMSWNTGTPSNPETGIAESQQAEFLIRASILGTAAGVDRICLGLDRGETVRSSPNLAWQDDGRWRLKPGLVAHKVFREQLGAARLVSEIFLPDRTFRKAYCYLFETDDHAVVTAWRRDGESQLTLPDGVQPSHAMDLYGNPLPTKNGRVRLSSSPVYLFFDRELTDTLGKRLPLAAMEYEDHPDSRWKQNLLDAVDSAAETPPKRYNYAAEGRDRGQTVQGVYRGGANMTAAVATVSGKESFSVDLSGLRTEQDLIIVRRVDLDADNQQFAVAVNDKEVARYDLGAMKEITDNNEKRFHDLVIPVGAGAIEAPEKSRTTVTFQATGDGVLTSGLTRFYGKDRGPLYLSDVDFIAARQSTMIPRMDENMIGNPLRVDDAKVAKGICTHARAQLAYVLGGQYDKFRFHPALEATPRDGSVVFQVLVDGEQVYKSDVLTVYETAEPITIDVAGAQSLVLRLDDGGDGIEGDWGVWGEARLE